jgi:uncharacterized protein YcbX
MGEILGRVRSLWRYPVKSMRGEELPRLDVDARGAVGDRLLAVRDPEGRLGSGKTTRRFRRIDGLLEFRAAIDDAVPVVHFPDGRALRGDDPAIHRALGAALGTEVTLAREAAVPHHDAAPLHLCTDASLAWLARRLPASAIDPRRFRPNVVVATGGAELVEERWIGRTLAIGDRLRIRVMESTERCVMVTAAQDDLGADPAILRTLAEASRQCFGVYAEILAPGPVERGDVVAFA